jgi:ABC-type antimicrobial peptide transport system permease subunit
MTQDFQSYQVLVARTRGDEQQLVADMRRTMFEIDPGVLLVEQHTMRYQLGATLFPIRVAATLVSVFGGVGLLLAAIGLYGVIAFNVARRAREIGIRMAIGAQPGAVLSMLMRQGLTLAGAGLVVGFALAAAATKMVADALYQVSAADPVSWTIAAIVVIGVAALANYIPAQRAMRLDPVRVLRAE